MFHLRLIKALSYHGIVKATQEKPDVYTDDEAVAQAAVATGYFELVESPSQEQEDPVQDPATEPEQEVQGKTLDDMTVAEIETCATYYGVSLKGVKGKANKIAALRAALGDKANGIVEYGSPTMTELQSE